MANTSTRNPERALDPRDIETLFRGEGLVFPAHLVRLIEHALASICAVRRGLAYLQTGGTRITRSRNMVDQDGDADVLAGLVQGSYPPEVREALMKWDRSADRKIVEKAGIYCAVEETVALR